LNTWFAGSEAGVQLQMSCLVMKMGKLTTTFPRSVGQIPIYYSHKNTGDHLVTRRKNLKISNLIISMKEMNLYFLLVLD
jgi:beta-glucosidase